MAPARKDKAHIAYNAPLIEFIKEKGISVGRISEISSEISSDIIQDLSQGQIRKRNVGTSFGNYFGNKVGK